MDTGVAWRDDVMTVTGVVTIQKTIAIREFDMISYEVTLRVEASLAQSVEDFMRQSHIPDIFATGCFRQVVFSRASPTHFRTAYQADTQADLDRYLGNHAPRFRAEVLAKFPEGMAVTREMWMQVEVWP
jgi:hypothetical protein